MTYKYIYFFIAIIFPLQSMEKILQKSRQLSKNIIRQTGKNKSEATASILSQKRNFFTVKPNKQESLKSGTPKKVTPLIKPLGIFNIPKPIDSRTFAAFKIARSYGTQSKDSKKEENEGITLDEKDPQFKDKILSIIKKWKPIKGPKTKLSFLSSIVSHVDKAFDFYMNAYIGFLAVSIATLLFELSPIKEWWEKKKKESGSPFESTVDFPQPYSEGLYKYSLDGEAARELVKSSEYENFVKELHKSNLTVADSVKILCQMQEEKMFAEFVRIGKLTDEEQRLLLNILNLRYELMQGHYDENNVTFEGEFKPEVKAMVIEALKRYDIPFKVNIHNEPKDISSMSLGVAGSTWVENYSDIQFKYHLKSSTAGISSKENVKIEVYLSPLVLSDYFSDDSDRKAVIAHEFTHVAQLHSLQHHFTEAYMTQVREKKISTEEWRMCEKIMNTVAEFQADILLLMYQDYAEAQSQRHKYGGKRPDIYVKSEDLYKLASRAYALHEAEQRLLLSKKQANPFSAQEGSLENRSYISRVWSYISGT